MIIAGVQCPIILGDMTEAIFLAAIPLEEICQFENPAITEVQLHQACRFVE
jgi:hypothetical protein